MNESKTKKPAGVKRKAKAVAKEPKPESKRPLGRSLTEKKPAKPKGKAKEEASGPKRSWPAFFFFQQEKRLQLKKDNPSLSQKELVSKLGELWRSLTDAQK